MRLTLLYGGLFLLSGAALMAITYALLVNAGFVFTIGDNTSVQTGPPTPPVHSEPFAAFPAVGTATHPSAQTMAHWRDVAQCMRQHGISQFPNPATSVPTHLGVVGEVSDRSGAILVIPDTSLQSPAFAQAAGTCGFDQPGVLTPQDVSRRTHVRQQLLIQSGIALAAMSLLSLGLGWLVAGRVLQPLEDSYRAQRQFVANASHELRAPLTRQRALIEVALASPDADFDSLRRAHERVLASEQHLEQLIDGLLALSRGQAGLERHDRLDLATLTSEVVLAHESELASLDLDLRTKLNPAPTPGDARLVERLITNLIDNAIRHNTPGGHVEITTGTRDRHAFVSIANSGTAVPPEEIGRLFQPFERLGAARTRHNNGQGLGLSIVQAIAKAHGAEVTAHARSEGGLTIDVSFIAASGRRRGLKFTALRSSVPRRSEPRRT